MNRKEFLSELKKQLKVYKKIDSEEIIYYYDEMIQDAVDAGHIERQFIAELGNIEEIVRNITGDESFIYKVKKANENSLVSLIGSAVKIISLIVYYFALFIIAIVCFSLFAAGIGTLFQAIIYFAFDSTLPSDTWILLGLVIIAIGLLLVSFSIIKKIFEASREIKLYIIRKTKYLFKKKGGELR
jgi:uncharacterized membrane protein